MKEQQIYIIDDDEAVLDSMSLLFEANNIPSICFDHADHFLNTYQGNERGCLILDIRMPGMSGLELQQKLIQQGSVLPVIFMTGHGDVPMAVEAMQQGAFNFLRKPVKENELLLQISKALEKENIDWQQHQQKRNLHQQLNQLTPREKEIFHLVAEGMANKTIATQLDISERTVEVHRAQVMKKLNVKTIAELVRLQLSTID